MTFDEKRKELLNKFDVIVAGLREIVADPAWTNDDYKPYKTTLETLAWNMRHLRELNQVEQS